MIHALRVSDLGCHLGSVYVGCIAYYGPDPTKVRGLVGEPDTDKVWSGPPSEIWMTIPLSYDSRPLVYCSRLNQQALSTAQSRRAGLLATADTRLALYSLHFLHTNGCNNKILSAHIEWPFNVILSIETLY